MAAGAAEEEGWSVLNSGTPQQKLVSQFALRIITLVALLTVATVALHKGLPHCSCTLIQSPEDRRFQTGSEW